LPRSLKFPWKMDVETNYLLITIDYFKKESSKFEEINKGFSLFHLSKYMATILILLLFKLFNNRINREIRLHGNKFIRIIGFSNRSMNLGLFDREAFRALLITRSTSIVDFTYKPLLENIIYTRWIIVSIYFLTSLSKPDFSLNTS
jgi:hypothetical protein